MSDCKQGVYSCAKLPVWTEQEAPILHQQAKRNHPGMCCRAVRNAALLNWLMLTWTCGSPAVWGQGSDRSPCWALEDSSLLNCYNCTPQSDPIQCFKRVSFWKQPERNCWNFPGLDILLLMRQYPIGLEGCSWLHTRLGMWSTPQGLFIHLPS